MKTQNIEEALGLTGIEVSTFKLFIYIKIFWIDIKNIQINGIISINNFLNLQLW